MTLREQITQDMKDYMRAQEKEKLGIIRLIQAAIKQREVDERITLDDAQIMAVLEKMVKQRRESIEQFNKANREDLVAQETFELNLIKAYLPEPLSDDEVKQLVNRVIAEVGASSIKDMGKVIAQVKEHAQGRVDMSIVGAMVKTLLS